MLFYFLEQLVCDLSRYVGIENLQEVVSEKFSSLKRQIFDQAKLESESNSCLKKVFTTMTKKAITQNFIALFSDNTVIALMLLVYMLPDVRFTPNADKVLYFTKVSYINLEYY